ncbi:efflux transporter outer membrane subunit [Collimonas sp.]|jgi:multidrug efflux system outer membrane protein|uniref:efflux transporter outer membrane subunit n=1 Tax=Collimonas sp. TaxID=1963772 RepID=UPI002C73C8D0|nr:efflux transporter outer membrane subunit [Collimonas sp.]HWX01132.1 efflux transporter outer membrane subunit [Collimonas sp.]
MKSARCLALLSAAAWLSGCASGPDYKKPELEMPAAWQSEQPFHAAMPNDSALKGNWWETFEDARLNQLEQLALAQNQTLQIAAARLEQARQQVTVSAAGLFPQVNLQAGADRAKISANRPLSAYSTPNQSTVQNNFQLGFAVNYEADLFGRVRRTVEQAKASSEQAAADFENARLVLMSELAADYFNLRELDAEIDVVRQGIALQQRALEFITARHDLGIASGLDLAQQQALLDANRTQLELLQNQRVQYEHALATMTGTPAPQFKLEAALARPVLAPPPVGLPSDVLQRRPDVASAERAMAAANAGIGVARAAYFPTILLQPNGGWDSNQIGNLLSAPSILWSLGTSLAQNLFDAGKTRAGVKIAEASYTAAVANYRQTVLVAMQEVEDGIDGLALLGRAGMQAEASVHSSQRVLDLANDRYSGGLDTYLDVITAQQTLLTNQRQAVQIHGQLLLTSVYLVKALGGGWQADAVQAAR